MLSFFKHLKKYFVENNDYSNENTCNFLKLYLKEIELELDDDATIGILITEEAIKYQKQKNKRVNENHSDNTIQEY
jgi:hypothetical protein